MATEYEWGEARVETVGLVLELIEDWRKDGIDPDLAIERAAALIDAAADLDDLLPAPWGALAEAFDDDLARLILRSLVALRRDPEAMRARAKVLAAKGRKRRARALRKRAARLDAARTAD
jgi:hypothetical protein